MSNIHATQRNDVTAIRRSLHRNPDLAVLGQTSDASSPVFVNDRPGYWWVREIQAGGVYGPAIQVRGCLIAMVTNPGVPVRLGITEGEKQVLGPDFVGLLSQGVNPTQSAVVDPNANNPAFVNQSMITTAYANIIEGTLTVGIRRWLPQQNDTIYNVGGTEDWIADFTGNVPISGEHCIAVIAVLPDFSALEVTYSTAKPDGIALDLDDVQEAISAGTSGATRLWAFSLADAQTELTEANRFLDLRTTISPESASGGSSFYQTVQGNGTPATQQPIIDFIDGTNTTVTVTNDGAGTRTKVKIDASFTDTGITQLTGDGTAGPGSGSQALTLATVNSNVGTFSRVKSVTANAKGLITAIAQGLVDLASEVTGLLGLANGGTGADLSGTGPGVPVQATSGAVFSVVSQLAQTYLNGNVKGFAYVASDTNINISSPGGTIGGVALSGTRRVLLTAQSTSSQNGLWVWTGASSALTRPTDFASGSVINADQGCVVPVLLGKFQHYVFVITNIVSITIDTTSQPWEPMTPPPNLLTGQYGSNGSTDYMFEFHNIVAAVATSNVSIASAPATIDGVSTTGIRVLLTAQSTASQNGLWIATSGAAMSRPDDYAAAMVLNNPSGITVEAGSNGTTNHDTRWRCTNTSTVTVDTTNTTWAQIVTPAGAVSGVLATGNIPNLDTSKITSGTFDQSFISRTTQLTPTNAIINSTFGLWSRQRITPTTLTAYSDDTYSGADLWYVLTQTASVQNARIAGDTNSQYAAQLKQNQASAQRMGYAQIIEAIETIPYRSRAVRLQARIRCSSNQAIRYAIVEWTGTADSPTSDVVNDWTSGTYTTGNFFISTTTTITATDHTTPAANTWTDISLTGTVSSSANNLILFIWTEGTAAQNVTLDISQVQFVDGTSAVAWIAPDQTQESLRAQRFLKVFSSANGVATVVLNGYSIANTTGRHPYTPPVPFIATPSLVATAGDWDSSVNGAVTAVTAISILTGSTAESVTLLVTAGAGGTSVSKTLQGDAAGDRYLILSAEL